MLLRKKSVAAMIVNDCTHESIHLTSAHAVAVRDVRLFYPHLRLVPRRHTRTPCCVCNACARLLVRFLFDFHILRHSCLHRAPQGAHQPLPCLRRARTASHIRLRRRAQRASALCDHLRQPPPRHSAPTTLHGCSLRAGEWAVACWRSALLRRATTPLHRFSAASRTDARSSSAPSAPCRLTGVQGRCGTRVW